MKAQYRVCTAWSPFWTQMGPNHKFPPSMFLKSIGDMDAQDHANERYAALIKERDEWIRKTTP